MKRLLLLSLLLISLLTSGCTSARYTNSFAQRVEPASHVTGPFRIVAANSVFKEATRRTIADLEAQQNVEAAERIRDAAVLVRAFYFGTTLLSDVREQSIIIYPSLFTTNRNATPLYLSTHDNSGHQSLFGLLTAFGSLSIIPPLPPIASTAMDSFSILNPAQTDCLTTPVQIIRTEFESTTLFSPLGLIPIPGKSDIPPYNTVSGTSSASWRKQQKTLDAQCIVHAIVRMLNQMSPHELEAYKQSYLNPQGSHTVTQPAQPTPQAQIHSKAVPFEMKPMTGHPHRGETLALLPLDVAGISETEAKILMDRFGFALDRARVYRRIPYSQMEKVLEAQEYSLSCSDLSCAIEAGRNLAARYIVFGSVGKVGKLFTVNVSLADVETTEVIGGAVYDFRGDIEDFLTEGMTQAAYRLLQDVQENTR